MRLKCFFVLLCGLKSTRDINSYFVNEQMMSFLQVRFDNQKKNISWCLTSTYGIYKAYCMLRELTVQSCLSVFIINITHTRHKAKHFLYALLHGKIQRGTINRLHRPERSSLCLAHGDRQKVSVKSDKGSAPLLFLLAVAQEWRGCLRVHQGYPLLS